MTRKLMAGLLIATLMLTMIGAGVHALFPGGEEPFPQVIAFGPDGGEEPFPQVIAFGPDGGEEPFPQVIAFGPEWSGFLDIDEWNFRAGLVTSSLEAMEARIIGTQIGGRFVAGLVEDEWTDVVPVGKQMEHRLDRYEELHRLLVERQAQLTGRGWTEDFEQKIRGEYHGILGEIGNIFAGLAEAGDKREGILAIIPSVPLNPGETIVVELVFEVRKTHDPTKRHQITFPTSVTELPPLSVEEPIGGGVWIPGDLHIHSIYSDGDFNLFHLRDTEPNMKGRGYRFVYMAEHVGYCQIDPPPTFPGVPLPPHLHRTVCLCPTGPGYPAPCNSPTTWECYVINTQRVTLPEIGFFPGAELSLAHTTLRNRAPEGHALIYGLTRLVRRDGQTLYCGEITAADLLTLKPIGSSLGIAHPPHLGPGCGWVKCSRGYHGAELMCPGPFWELSWWRARAFTPEALADAVRGLPVLSVRTGSDFHGPGFPRYPETWFLYQAYTYVRIPIPYSEWQTASWCTRRQLVNQALREGQTVASRHGSFARLTVNGRLPGSVIYGVPANSTLSFNVRFRPFRTNPYRIRIFKNRDTVVEDHWVNGTAGKVISLDFTGTFPGATHGYWLIVEEGNWGTEVVYSSPVIVTSRASWWPPTLKIEGSATVYTIIRATELPFEALWEGTDVRIAPTSSTAGIERLLANEIDIAMACCIPQGLEEELFHIYLIARDAVAMIVRDDPAMAFVDNLTRDQLRGIYEGTITTWSHINPAWPAVAIVPRAGILPSGTRDSFHDLSQIGNTLEKAAIEATGLPRLGCHFSMVAAIAANDFQIGYVSLPWSGKPGIRAVPVEGVTPSVATVRDGIYPMPRDLYLLTRKDDPTPNARADDFINYMFTEAGQGHVEHPFINTHN